jgi:glycosyltransferase involved in cell wall biosynthesis
VRAFNQLGYPLVIIGDGPDLPLIRRLAKSNIKVLGNQSNQIVEQYMAKAKAFVYAACEDFGIALVEAQACGTPVIAYGGGGALETVIDIRQYPQKGTGILFSSQTSGNLVKAIETFAQFQHLIKSESCRRQAAKFTPKIFEMSYLAFLKDCEKDFLQKSSEKSS